MDEWINTFFFISTHYLKCSRFHTRRSFKKNSALCLAEEELPSHDIVALLPGMNGGHYKAVGMSALQCALDPQREKQVSCHGTIQNVFRCTGLSERPSSAPTTMEKVQLLS